MRGLSRVIAVVTLIIALTIPFTLGHSYLTNPISRSNQRQSNAGCRGPTCTGPCEVKKADAKTAPLRVQRGQSVSVEWPRNNHAGGFIRLAWAPLDQSDSHTAFDNGVQKIVCHEIGGCGPDDASNPNGGDSGPADGSKRACKTSLTIPKHLPDGKWTLQWSWYGGAFALSDYYSCVDFDVAGGATGAREDPSFKGGDFANPGTNKCKYFNTNALHVCTSEPCVNPPRPGEQHGAPANSTLWGNYKPGSSNPPPGPSSSGEETVPPTTPPTTPPETSSGGSSTSGDQGEECAGGTTRCNPTPESKTTFQCCAPGTQCFATEDKGICCGPFTEGCLYGDVGAKKASCCDTRYLKCDTKQGCITK